MIVGSKIRFLIRNSYLYYKSVLGPKIRIFFENSILVQTMGWGKRGRGEIIKGRGGNYDEYNGTLNAINIQ